VGGSCGWSLQRILRLLGVAHNRRGRYANWRAAMVRKTGRYWRRLLGLARSRHLSSAAMARRITGRRVRLGLDDEAGAGA